MQNKRIEWLALLRGLNILLVVMFHVQLIDLSTGQNHLWCEVASAPFSYFRMPLFIFVSGGLLYLSRIRKEWPIKKLYVDKVKRIVLPFLFFVTFYYVFKLLLNSFVKTKVEASVSDFLLSFVIFSNHPSAHLWFLATLIQLMFLYPLFVWLCGRWWSMALFGAFSIVFYFVDLSWMMSENYFHLLSLGNYLVFFFFGIFFFRYKGWQFTNSWLSVFILIAIYVLTVWLHIPLISSLVGILMMVSISQRLACVVPGLFSSFREYIFPIYLMSFIFQPFVELILWKKIFYNEQLFPFFYVLNILLGIYGSVLVCKIIERIPFNYVKYCFGLSSSLKSKS